MDVTINDEPDASRFVIMADGEPAGEITYRFHDDRRLIVHTGVDAAFEGKGIGGRAAAALLDLIRAQGERIVPLCPFVASYIERHPEADDLVDHDLYDEYRRRQHG